MMGADCLLCSHFRVLVLYLATALQITAGAPLITLPATTSPILRAATPSINQKTWPPEAQQQRKHIWSVATSLGYMFVYLVCQESQDSLSVDQ